MKNKKPAILTLNVLLFSGLAAIGGFFGYIKYGQYQKQKEVEAEKAELVRQASELQDENAKLEKMLSYLDSSEFKEKMAREQFNLKKPDEKVFGFTESKIPVEAGMQTDKKKESNPLKWWRYFYPNGK